MNQPKQSATRLCSCCKVEKPDGEFYAGQKRPCKECMREKARQYRSGNEDLLQRARDRSKRPDEKVKKANQNSQKRKWVNYMYHSLCLSDSDY